MMKRILWLAILVSSTLCVSAQDSKTRTLNLWGHVKSAYIKQGILGAKVTLMLEDSTVVDTMRVFQEWHGDNKIDAAYKFVIPAVRRKYIIRAEHPDYEPLDVNFSVPPIGRNTVFEATYHFLKPRQKNYDVEGGMLDEVVVQKTRVKVFAKGDTIVYNADAFNLPEGSMLDDLIKQLPGAELRDDQILVNGEVVEELTLNGKDFFGSSKKVMLENLPYYTVNQLKVFRKNTDKNEWLGREVEKKRLTMDVVLKREYNTGMMGNATVGGATDDLWLARFFGLRYTDNSRATLYVNGNNMNGADKAGKHGEWEGGGGSGRHQSRTAGLDILVDDADKRWQENFTANFKWKKSNLETKVSGEQFLANAGSSYNRIVSQQRDRDVSGEVNNYFKTIDSRNPWHTHFNAGFWFGQQKNNSHSRSAQADSNPEAWGGAQEMLDSVFAARLNPGLQQLLVNRNLAQAKGDNRSIGQKVDAGIWHKMPWGDDGGVNVRTSATHAHGNQYSQQRIDYLRAEGQSVNQNRYNSTHPNNTYEYAIAPYYEFSLLHGWSLYTDYTYYQRYYSQGNDAYLLDRLSGYDALGNNLGMLPSTRDSLQLARDLNNTNRQTGMKRDHALAGALSYSKNNIWARLYLTLRHLSNRIHYDSHQLDTTMTQRNWTIEPDLDFTYTRPAKNDSAFRRTLRLHYNFSQTPPSLLLQLPVRNDQDPLNISLGNPDLKLSATHVLSASLDGFRSRPSWLAYGLNANVSVLRNSISRGYTYDPLTGVYTHRPLNVNGNWNAALGAHVTGSIDGKRSDIQYSSGLSGSYARNVDYASLAGSTSSQLSHVDNWYTNANASFTYALHLKKHLFQVTTSGSVGYRHAHQKEGTFDDVNAVNFNYGLKTSYHLSPLNVSVSSNLTMYSTRGYNDSSLNRNDLIWNASLGKYFPKALLDVSLQACDLLHQLSNISVMVNGQGRTETWTNSLPRYVMLKLAWRFQKYPKRQNKQRDMMWF